VDKTQFKVSSLDQLMTLNETTAKLDSQLEVLTKKFEKVAMDTGTKQFFFDEESSSKSFALSSFARFRPNLSCSNRV